LKGNQEEDKFANGYVYGGLARGGGERTPDSISFSRGEEGGVDAGAIEAPVETQLAQEQNQLTEGDQETVAGQLARAPLEGEQEAGSIEQVAANEAGLIGQGIRERLNQRGQLPPTSISPQGLVQSNGGYVGQQPRQGGRVFQDRPTPLPQSNTPSLV
jgi:hypothetical protein